MGLFSRKKTEQASRSASRTATSSEAQAAELRGRARRRLIGALVLVLTAIIVVPMMFDDPAPQQPETPLVFPAIVPPVSEPDLALAAPGHSVDQPALSGDTTSGLEESGMEAVVQDDDAAVPDAPEQAEAQQVAEAEAGQATASVAAPPAESSSATPEAPARPQPEKPVTPEPVQQKPTPAHDDTRTDDGSVALALLEGRTPPSAGSTPPAQPERGSFVLQVAAYSTEADAQSRRTSLVNAGVTNAYVERAISNERTTYRLRVGSFPTRDAAQAAQARLRALGYDNSLLLTQ